MVGKNWRHIVSGIGLILSALYAVARNMIHVDRADQFYGTLAVALFSDFFLSYKDADEKRTPPGGGNP